MTRRPNFSGVLLFIISLTVSVGIAEIGTRILLKEEVDTQLLKAQLEQTTIAEVIRPSANPQIFYELKPNLNITFQNIHIVTDQAGSRISATPPSAKNNPIRIAVLGDSTSFGWGVEYEQTYPEKYRQQMEAITNSPIELRNYSVPGYNSQQLLHVFLEKVIPYQPDLLLLHHDPNDPEDIPFSSLSKDAPNYIPPEYGDNLLNLAFLKLIIRTIQKTKIRRAIAEDHTAHNEYIDGYIAGGPAYQKHLQTLQKLINEADKLNIPIIVIIFDAFIPPIKNYRNNKRYLRLHKNLADRLQAMGYYPLDLYPLSIIEMEQNNWTDFNSWYLSEMDHHSNATGHQFIADKLVEYTRSTPALWEIFQSSSQAEFTELKE